MKIDQSHTHAHEDDLERKREYNGVTKEDQSMYREVLIWETIRTAMGRKDLFNNGLTRINVNTVFL